MVLTGCGKGDLCVEREISRTPSPDKLADAVISMSDCGATTSNSYRVYVVKVGGGPVEDDVVFLADKVEDINVFWQAPRKLLISYKEARIFRFTNFWSSEEMDNFRYVVSIAELQDLRAGRGL